ncbi:hypothetical protein [Caldinitratiruptor microaerophilus]|uniref:Uncharacterized protein n=1 Tax=Caldinitratiruptor microaerophilus TaxID=671077 RepID=A0AA35CIG1_9FIRM|nr:hypothetical protein [Caldinitratiruptor microaerophilus]BDG59642.1 hypothetical protein caldi_07320 [Caldinitratiruptor microaerophilus]
MGTHIGETVEQRAKAAAAAGSEWMDPEVAAYVVGFQDGARAVLDDLAWRVKDMYVDLDASRFSPMMEAIFKQMQAKRPRLDHISMVRGG